ncbi:hypothetical protein GCM10026983_38910 [Gracilibacillus alcaliphilus]
MYYKKLFKKSNKNDTANVGVDGRGTSTKIPHIVWAKQKSTHPVQVRGLKLRHLELQRLGRHGFSLPTHTMC